jgi:uncharacterized protein YigA (DUF484 family)
MLSPRKMGELLRHAQRNEEILKRLDEVEFLLLGRHGLDQLLPDLCRTIGEVYGLEAVTVVLSRDHERLWRILGGPRNKPLPFGCFWRSRKDLRIILSDLERPFLCNRVGKELVETFFPKITKPASISILPLWSRGLFLGALCLGSSSEKRYEPGLETDFLSRLGRKIAIGMETCLVMDESKGMERREAALEMAGAACHELAQPVTTLAFMVDKLLRTASKDDPLYRNLLQLAREVDRVGALVHRISQVSEYVTKPYVKGMKIIDVDAAAGKNGPGKQKEVDK